MSGRPIRIVTTAAVAAIVSAISISAASAGCWTCGTTQTYVAPPAVYYAPPCGGCGQTYLAPRVVYAPPCGYCYHPQRVYRVEQGPVYTAPVTMPEEPEVDDYGDVRAYPYVGDDYGYRHRRWRRHHVAYEPREYHHHFRMHGRRFLTPHPVHHEEHLLRFDRHDER